MRKTLSFLAAGLMLTGCGFEPTAGEWQVSLGTVVTDTCEFPDTGVEPTDPEPSDLVIGEDGAFTFGEANCTLDGKDFSCTLDIEPTDLSPLDFVVSYTNTNTGTFDGADSASGTSAITIDCAGADCDPALLGAAAFPCTIETDYTMALVAE